MKKILVVGGAGYIGGITTDMLIDKGHEVTVYDKLFYETRFLKDVNFIYGDIRNTEVLYNIHDEYDEIIWLAALVGDGACAQDPNLAREINVTTLKNFLNKTERRVIFTSTCSVYGAQDGILNEESKTNPLSVYAATKLEAEKIVLENDGLIFRLGTLFGLGDRYSRIRLDLVVNILSLRAFRDNKITVFGGEQWRPLLAVKDVAGYLSESINSRANTIFNLKFKNYKIVQLAKEIQKHFKNAEIEITDMKFEDLRNYKIDSAKADEYFDFQPRTTINQEVERLKKLFSEVRIKDVNNPVYYNTSIVQNLKNNREGGIYIE